MNGGAGTQFQATARKGTQGNQILRILKRSQKCIFYVNSFDFQILATNLEFNKKPTEACTYAMNKPTWAGLDRGPEGL